MKPAITVTSVYVDDQAKALAFYTDMLGFVKKTDVPVGDARWLTVVGPDHLDGVELLLEPSGHPASVTFKAALYADGIPLTMFGVDDIDAAHAELTAKGVRFTLPPTDMGTVRIAVLDDTCGNLIQLAQTLQTTTDDPKRPSVEAQTFLTFIEAPAQRVWDAITSSEFMTRYGYGGEVEFDLRPGGAYRNLTTAGMRAMGMGDTAVTGKVLEADAPRRLVQTWIAAWHNEETTLTWEITEFGGGLSRLVLTHDCTGAPNTARDIAGFGDPTQGGGGWPWILASLKTLLETGRSMVGSGS